MAFEHLITKAGQRQSRWLMVHLLIFEAKYTIENERISISCPETEISKKFTLLHIKTNTDILFFISERLKQRLMKFCQKSKSTDVTAASGHLLCKFFRILNDLYLHERARPSETLGVGFT